MTTAKNTIAYMESLRNEEQRQVLMRFFKTGPGEYGEGDEFLGLKVPQTREVARAAKDMPLSEVPLLLQSRWHEVRLCGLLILVSRFERLATKRLTTDAAAVRQRDDIVKLYLQHAEQANNWDLVDLSAPKILGHWLLLPTLLGPTPPEGKKESALLGPTPPAPFEKTGAMKVPALPKREEPVADLRLDYKRHVLDELAESGNLWRQRMSIVCTWKTSQQGNASWCLRYAEKHLHHPHDLMHKAVGWMLREMGKRVSMDLLRDFLRQHVREMPRTTLRYAIEKMTEAERREWMSRT